MISRDAACGVARDNAKPQAADSHITRESGEQSPTITPSWKNTMLRQLCFLVLLNAISCWLAVPAAHADENWPGWRGPAGTGHANEKAPSRWSANSVVWRTALPGIGQSSPIVWGDRIFLTSAMQDGKQRVVLCVDRKTGSILWQHEAWLGVPEVSHKMNGWASSTCVTDGERVFAFFGKGGMHCYAVDGKPLWSRNLGTFPGPWGTSACPILFGDLVIQNCDALEKAAYMIALNKKTGEPVWKTARPSVERGGWSTPVMIQTKSRTEMVLNGEPAVKGYDPLTGKELWTCKSFAGRGEPGRCKQRAQLARPETMREVNSRLVGGVFKADAGWVGRLRCWRTCLRRG